MSEHRIGIVVFLWCILGSLVGGIAAAAPVLDQESPALGESFPADYTGVYWQQGVTAGVAGLLTRVDLYIAQPGDFWDLNIWRGAPWQNRPADFYLYATLWDVPAGWLSLDVSAGGLLFDVGDQFTIGVNGIAGGDGFKGPWLGGSHVVPGGAYAGGALWWDDFYHGGAAYGGGNGDYDFAFRTYMDPQVVPAPAAVALVALGAGLVARLRTRRSL